MIFENNLWKKYRRNHKIMYICFWWWTNKQYLRMERYLIIKTRDELLRIKIGQILYFEADRNYTKLLLSNGIQFTFAINIGKIEEILEKQVAGCNTILMRVGKSHIINKNHILQINLPKQKLLLLTQDGKPRSWWYPWSFEGIERYARKGNGKTWRTKSCYRMIIRIGKASDNDFVVNDPHVSRYHAKLIREEGDVGYLKIWDRQTEHLSMVPRSLRSMLLPAIRSSWEIIMC